jgi:hypothetical protein
VELANTINRLKGITKRGVIVQARVASSSIRGGGFDPFHELPYALRFKASAVKLHNMRGFAMIFQKSQPSETRGGVLSRRAH